MDIPNNKKYENFKIPSRQQSYAEKFSAILQNSKKSEPKPLDKDEYYEIEYDASPIPGVGKFVLKHQKIEPPKKDEIRELFQQMRNISSRYNATQNYSRFFDKRVQQSNAAIFYQQGLFMKDFVDDYSERIPFSQYFPYYQMMGYEQLRTYFTWRTEVRNGNVTDISLSYAFLYLYELLDNIGVKDPHDGLEQLLFFWKAFRVYNKALDKYIYKWLKDYHIYYNLPQPFHEFAKEQKIDSHYPRITDLNDSFNLFCNISKYDIRKSNFYTNKNMKLITECFNSVIDTLKQTLTKNDISFDESIFQPTKKMLEWKPFRDALFYPWLKQPDRRVVFSENEIYICKNNQWFTGTVITSEDGRQLIGYIMKQMEVDLRKLTKYQYKISANIDNVQHELIKKLKAANLSLEQIITTAVLRFYKEATKTVVKVDPAALSRIRKEALSTQEKLLVPEQEVSLSSPVSTQISLNLSDLMKTDSTSANEQPSIHITSEQTSSIPDVWVSFKNALTEIELNSLPYIIQGESELKKYASQSGVMLEVLIDGINEKAMDLIGDNLIDEDFVIYDDYKEQVKELIK